MKRTVFDLMARSACLGLAVATLALALPAAAQDGANARIAETGEIRIGYRPDDTPFSMAGTGDVPTGYAIELCQHVVETIEQETGPLNVVYVPLTASQRIRTFDQNQIDMLCAGTSMTLTRRQGANFSIPIYFDGVAALVSDVASERAQAIFAGERPRFRPGWRASLAEVFGEVNILVIEGTQAQAWLLQGIHQFLLPTTVTAVADTSEAVQKLRDGEGMAFFAMSSTLTEVLGTEGIAGNFYISPVTYTRQPLAIVFSREDDDLTLAADVALSALYRSGDIIPIYERYFGPASDQVKDLFALAAIPE